MELDIPTSIPDACDDEETDCDENVGVLADELGCCADDERRWLLRDELDVCNPCVLEELDNTAAPLDSAGFDIAELEVGCSAAMSDDDSWTETDDDEYVDDEWGSMLSGAVLDVVFSQAESIAKVAMMGAAIYFIFTNPTGSRQLHRQDFLR